MVYEVLAPAEDSSAGTVMILVVGTRKAGDKDKKDVYRLSARRLG